MRPSPLVPLFRLVDPIIYRTVLEFVDANIVYFSVNQSCEAFSLLIDFQLIFCD